VSWLLAISGFALLIVLHEAGHMVAAKAVGMRVEKFSLFFGPMLVKFRRGETTYGIGPIPLGGYVKITGMSPYEELEPEVKARAYLNQPVWKRIVVISAGPAVNLVLAFLILWGLSWHNGLASRSVDEIQPRTPAAGVLQAGDELVAVDGERGSRGELIQAIQEGSRCPGELRPGCRASEPLAITFLRDGSERTAQVTPVFDAEVNRMRIGFSFSQETVPIGAGRAAQESVNLMWLVTSGTVSTLAQLFKAEKREQLSGVVGVTERTSAAFDVSVLQALFLLGVVSLSLGVINLFPFLPLDGGHIFWALAEKLRGRAIDFRIMERAGIVGFVLVIGLFFIGLSNDIGRLTGDEFGVR
jgi:regulator of sigma E protease